jgi:hypothetical protein
VANVIPIPEVWKKRLAVGGVWLVSVLGAFTSGRMMTPPKTEVQTEQVFVERHHYHTVQLTVRDQEKHVAQHVTITKKPDGTVTKVVDTKMDSASHESTKTNTQSDSSVQQKEKEKTTVTGYRPQWRFGLTVGIDPATITAAQTIGGLGTNAIYGVEVQRNIAGPFNAGAWINTRKQFGLGFSMDF